MKQRESSSKKKRPTSRSGLTPTKSFQADGTLRSQVNFLPQDMDPSGGIFAGMEEEMQTTS